MTAPYNRAKRSPVLQRLTSRLIKLAIAIAVAIIFTGACQPRQSDGAPSNAWHVYMPAYEAQQQPSNAAGKASFAGSFKLATPFIAAPSVSDAVVAAFWARLDINKVFEPQIDGVPLHDSNTLSNVFAPSMQHDHFSHQQLSSELNSDPLTNRCTALMPYFSWQDAAHSQRITTLPRFLARPQLLHQDCKAPGLVNIILQLDGMSMLPVSSSHPVSWKQTAARSAIAAPSLPSSIKLGLQPSPCFFTQLVTVQHPAVALHAGNSSIAAGVDQCLMMHKSTAVHFHKGMRPTFAYAGWCVACCVAGLAQCAFIPNYTACLAFVTSVWVLSKWLCLRADQSYHSNSKPTPASRAPRQGPSSNSKLVPTSVVLCWAGVVMASMGERQLQAACLP